MSATEFSDHSEMKKTNWRLKSYIYEKKLSFFNKKVKILCQQKL